MNKNKKIDTILITGINGFLGSHIANKLSKIYNIIGLDYGLNDPHRNLESKPLMYSSLTNNVENIFVDNKIDAVIHTATVYQKFNNSFEKLIKTNILLPVQLLELSNKHNVLLFVNTDTFFNIPKSNYSYLSYYTLSKRHFIDWRDEIKGGCKLVTLKLFHLYGPNDKPTKFVPSIINSLIDNNLELNLTEGEQMRDFVYVDDVVNAYLCVLKNFIGGHELLKEYEVGTMKAFSIKSLVTLLKDLTASKTQLNFDVLPYRENEIMYARANNKPLIELGWKIENDLKEGLIKTIEYYRKKR